MPKTETSVRRGRSELVTDRSAAGPLSFRRERRSWRVRLFAVAAALFVGSLAAAQGPHTTTRLTFYASSAIVPGSVQGLQPDINGDLKDPATGRTYSTYDVPGAGGHGFTQVDVVYADDQVCVGAVTILGLDVMTNALTTLGTSGFVTPSEACADYWVAPGLLGQNQAFITPGLTVTRGQIQLRNGNVVEVVGHRTVGSGSVSQATYELATGFLLVGSTAVQGGAIPTLGPGNVVTAGSGGSTLTFTELLNVRTYQLPTASALLPDHVRVVREIVYDCVSGTQLAGNAVELPCETRFVVDAAGAQWLSLKSVTLRQNAVTSIPDVSEGSTVITMAMGAGGLFVAPEVLRGLRPEQQIDLDPITNIRTVVQNVTDRTVTLNISSNGESAWLVYDSASGWLVESYLEQQVGQGSSYVRLRLSSIN